LACLDYRFPFIFLAVDMLVYLGIKVLRRDFIYWFPLDGFSSLTMSLLIRAAVKVVTDYTGCIHLRHPNEVSNFGEGLNENL
jgi:hypothetical protein